MIKAPFLLRHSAQIYDEAKRHAMLDEIFLVLLGFGAGTVGSLVGLGGGIVIAPVLTFLGLPPAAAASSSLMGAFGNIGAATLTHTLKRRIRYQLGLKLGLIATPGTVLGAWLAGVVEPSAFKILFGVALLAVCAYILIRSKMKARSMGETILVMIVAAVSSFSAGVVSSFFGIGGGIVFVPLMMLVMGMTMKDGAAAAQPALLVIVAAGIISHGVLGHLDVGYSILLLIGGFCGGLLGTRISHGLNEMHLRVIVSVLITAAAVRLFWEALDEAYRGGLFLYGLPGITN